MKTIKPILYVISVLFICGSLFLPATANAVPSITSPVDGSTLSGSSETFNWTANGTRAKVWIVWAGPCDDATFGGCGDDYYNSGYLTGTTLTNTASNLPTDGSTVYVRLWYYSGGWQSVLYTYTAFSSGGGGIPEITSPVPDSTLSGSTVTFIWTDNGTSVTAWWLYIGTNVGGSDIHDSGDLGTGTSTTVNGLPTNGSTVYVRLSYYTGEWQFADFQYAAYNDTTTLETLIDAICENATLTGASNEAILTLCPELSTMTVFVSSATYNGNLGGLSGADAKCQSLAEAAGLAGTYKAWLSNSWVSAYSRLTHRHVPYVLVDGTLVANDWDDFADNSVNELNHAINLDEAGEIVADETKVWTNTLYAKIVHGLAHILCEEWYSGESDKNGYVGEVGGGTNREWEIADVYDCSMEARLYCFQQ